MFVAYQHAIRHFPAQNLSYYKDIDGIFFDDNGNRVDNDKLEEVAQKEIDDNTFTTEGTMEALSASLAEHGFGTKPFKIFPIGDVNDDPFLKIEAELEKEENA